MLAAALASSPPPAGAVNWGIMGTSDIARKVARALEAAPSATIVAVASRQLENAVKFTVELATAGTVVLLHPPLHLVGVSI